MIYDPSLSRDQAAWFLRAAGKRPEGYLGWPAAEYEQFLSRRDLLPVERTALRLLLGGITVSVPAEHASPAVQAALGIFVVPGHPAGRVVFQGRFVRYAAADAPKIEVR